MSKLMVTKRDGAINIFDKSKIEKAILKSMKYGSGETNPRVANQISKEIESEALKNKINPITIKNIEDQVYHKLIVKGYEYTAKSYEGFRAIQEFRRNTRNTTDESVTGILNKCNHDIASANSNKNSKRLSTQRDLIAGEVSKDISQRLNIPTRIIQAHNAGAIWYHDMDYAMQGGMFNCCLINLQDMLDNGTVINGVKIDSPHSFQTACNIMTQIMADVASSQYGGQSVNIKYLGKYLRRTYDKAYEHYTKDCGFAPDKSKVLAKDLTNRELQSGVQTIQYQINTLQTTNGQSPFVTLFLPIEIGYEYEDEVVEIIVEILKQRIQGVKNEAGAWVTPTFPKLVYLLDECNNLTGGKYDYVTKLAAECSSKRMYPDYLSAKLMRTHYDGNVFYPMGCRSFLSPWKDRNGVTKFEGRFNQGVVSLNLPQIGILANKDEDKFWSILDSRLQLCYEALMYRHEQFRGVTSDVSPIHWQYGAIARLKPGEKIWKYMNDCYSTISLGYIGLYEVTVLMKGKSHTSEDGQEFALRVMKKLRSAVDKWKKDTNIGFALYGTPAESLCYKFCEIDKKQFGVIPDVTDKGYYTNSYHVDVRERIDAFSKLKFEEQFQKISSGGCISYVEFPTMYKNVEALEQVIKFIYDNIQYAEFNTKLDYCCDCGYAGELFINDDGNFECPQCHNTDRSHQYVTRRTCGYLGSQEWNDGKMKEFKQRYVHLGDD